MGGRDHSCEVCGRGGFNDPGGVCECSSASRSPRDLEKEARGSDMPPAAVDAATKALNEWEDDSFDPDGVAAAIAAALPHLVSGPVLQEGEKGEG